MTKELPLFGLADLTSKLK